MTAQWSIVIPEKPCECTVEHGETTGEKCDTRMEHCDIIMEHCEKSEAM